MKKLCFSNFVLGVVVCAMLIVCIEAKPRQSAGKVKLNLPPKPTAKPPFAGKPFTKSELLSKWAGYRNQFEQKRATQTSALQRLLQQVEFNFKTEKERLEAQEKVVVAALDRLFAEAISAKNILNSMPRDGKGKMKINIAQPGVLQTVLSVWENAAFAADFLTLLPDVSISLVANNGTRMDTMMWAFDFCMPFYRSAEKALIERAEELVEMKKYREQSASQGLHADMASWIDALRSGLNM